MGSVASQLRSPPGQLWVPDMYWLFSDTNLMPIYCKPLYTLLFGVQLCMTIKTHIPYDCIHTLNKGFTANDPPFY